MLLHRYPDGGAANACLEALLLKTEGYTRPNGGHQARGGC
jgi:hypothetical protein